MTWFRCGMKKFVDNTTLNSLIDRSITSIKYTGTQVGYYAFYGCHSLTNVEFTDIDSISPYAFNSCDSLTELDMQSVRIIYAHVFDGCTALNKIILRRDTMTQLFNVNSFTNTPFDSTGTGGTIYVPSDLISTYEANAVWGALLALNANNKIEAITT